VRPQKSAEDVQACIFSATPCDEKTAQLRIDEAGLALTVLSQ
jgi:hypothetical protein